MRRPTDENDGLRFVHYTSPYFERIRYELMRYCSGEINGLSVLISGQRGAGKTTLTKLVIQKVMQDSEGLIPLPLLLHGPTVIDPEAVTSPANGRDSEHDSAPKEKERALRHIITALYRSLSTAFYDAWLIAAEEAPVQRRAQRELLGLRAHLDLRLERAPDSDVLRKIWSRAGFLECGVAFYLRPHAPHPGGRRNADIPPIAETGTTRVCARSWRFRLAPTPIGSSSARPRKRFRTEERAEHMRDLRMLVPVLPGGHAGAEDGKTRSSLEKLAPPCSGRP